MVMASWSRPVAWMRATPLTSRGVAKQITAARLRWLRARPPSEELEQIVGQADQRPLRDRAPRPRGRRRGPAMRVPVRRHVTVDALDGGGGQIRFAEIAGIGRHNRGP